MDTPIRVTEIDPGKNLLLQFGTSLMSLLLGMVETEFALVRFRGDAAAAKKVYDGLEPRESMIYCSRFSETCSHISSIVTGHDIAEEIVWTASRPPHVNVAEVLVYPVNQASAIINYRNTNK